MYDYHTFVCDRCGREITHDEHSEWSETLRLRFTGGYGSVFGDGARVEADLCQQCVKELIGPCLACTGLKDTYTRFWQSLRARAVSSKAEL